MTAAAWLSLSRSLLPNGDYRIRVYPESGFSARPLAEEPLRVKAAEYKKRL